MACSLGKHGLHPSWACRSSTRRLAGPSSLANSLKSESESATKRGFSTRMDSPRVRVRVAKAPQPAMLDGETAKEEFWKRGEVGC